MEVNVQNALQVLIEKGQAILRKAAGNPDELKPGNGSLKLIIQSSYTHQKARACRAFWHSNQTLRCYKEE
ncbi:hypothetical protein [Paenibacillus etheri]|uniref:hypothetical protein n=1 Tax=Paenibacillus etheri TaxID=1306852 RepID=UPI001AE0BD96|nr:hypothetical protein [Paenibacillus etheri]